MKLSDYAGDIRISSEDAKTFIKSWFKPEDKICVITRRSVKTGNLDVISQSLSASEFLDTVNDDSLEELIFGTDGSHWNVYVAVSPIIDDVSLQRRGGEDNVAYSPGVWADIDVKDGGFASEHDILEWINTLEIEPTIVCGSGSGGVHAYWKLHWNERGDKELLERWWSYLDESAGDRSIDKLVDLTRILRIPGTVYFPKEEANGKIGTVKIINITNKTYSLDQLRSISEDAFNFKNEKRAKVINREAQRRVDVDEVARDLLDPENNRWRLYQAIAQLEDYVNQKWEWGDILLPSGWTYLRQLRDDSHEWARPGRKERSAVVDYDGSPVMSLLSLSEDTGLADLKDARVPLTKYRCALRLLFNDDYDKMIKYVIEEQQNKDKD